MTEELETLRDMTARLESAGIDYMLTGSVALNCYAQPRMTRDIDLVVAFLLKDAERIEKVLGEDYYVSQEAAREAVLHQSSFNAIHQRSLIKVDFMIRKNEEYRRHEFTTGRGNPTPSVSLQTLRTSLPLGATWITYGYGQQN